jgi:alkylation response protein AidB-like acyl-CoA dehydrogenase
MPDAVQIHGGYGLMRDSEIDRICRGAKLHEIRAGTTEVRQVISSEEFNNARRRANG